VAIQDRVRLGPIGNSVWFSVIAVVVISALLVGCDVLTCDETAARSASAAAEGISTVRIIAEAGDLDVQGQLNLTEVEAEGTACASNTSDLDDIQFEVSTDGAEMVIEARTPGNTRFDVTVTVPDSVLVEIEDGSGDIDVRDVAGVRVTDGSGDVDVAGVSGDLVVSDDGSGDLDLSDVAGAVEIESDGSGDITVGDVGGDVRIGSDGSGSIRVSNVAGDFEVGSDGSGNISHNNVGGTVDIPDN
jgi:hypothetical protein